jgi:hypothetical protein
MLSLESSDCSAFLLLVLGIMVWNELFTKFNILLDNNTNEWIGQLFMDILTKYVEARGRMRGAARRMGRSRDTHLAEIAQ